MSNNAALQSEKQEIDNLIKKGYVMTSSKGTFDGDVVVFENKMTFEKKTLLLTHPDSRKYFATLYIQQYK
ncbi:hypothetical protein GCM10007063_17950 [Lentibacillus kapialis]|uniref:Uncharacterized protein n=1 Tax=Lentibacillus kapialis TaxID=340214 RepID=A0A917PWW0_9BACI|nr:hypothetical protein [Lentibacillus kapialis]GGJ95869.1 hypothetical protein GCM10007063_17950 [Lentibacillus kapialis]